jgi:N-acetylglucosamine kinase-like BadF-type ATPase
MQQQFVIGVDGGGTHTRVSVANLDGKVITTVEAPSSAISANGLDAAQRVLLEGIQLAQQKAGLLNLDSVKAICFGLSGADRPSEREPLQRWAQANFKAPARFVNDSELVLAAGCPTGWGVALIAGTGSIAIGVSADGTRARAGGWGYLIGDEGSAYYIANQAVRAATRAADGRGEKTTLLGLILQHWQLRDAAQLVPHIYRHPANGGQPMHPAQLAALAPLVAQAANTDSVAHHIVWQAGHALSELVLAVARKLKLPHKNTPLALAGGVLLGLDGLRGGLLHWLNGSDFVFAPITPVPQPVLGAVRLACQHYAAAHAMSTDG